MSRGCRGPAGRLTHLRRRRVAAPTRRGGPTRAAPPHGCLRAALQVEAANGQLRRRLHRLEKQAALQTETASGQLRRRLHRLEKQGRGRSGSAGQGCTAPAVAASRAGESGSTRDAVRSGPLLLLPETGKPSASVDPGRRLIATVQICTGCRKDPQISPISEAKERT
jgi:hypothetical protein